VRKNKKDVACGFICAASRTKLKTSGDLVRSRSTGDLTSHEGTCFFDSAL
jgi:hypothetical protein